MVAISDAMPFAHKVALGLLNGVSGVNKFGRNIEVDAGVTADLWDGGHTLASGGVSLIWVPPTQARIHAIVSSDAGDDSAGLGAKTIRIYGLTDWDTKEVSEDIIMDGTTPVNTVNSYVIIHRMMVLTKGATNVNIGIIKATAATDSTITAQIRAGQGQTQMAILGVPSNQTILIDDTYGSLNRAGGAATGFADKQLLVNPEPQTELLNFISKSNLGLSIPGTSHVEDSFDPPKMFPGPCIIKVQSSSLTANLDISGGFDGVLYDNADS
uniref:Uncharacterized protein n=1 Tax=uncultured marine virus TaxID=186617 RepID=A0A0F7L6Z5_9VIRU|nr:hypothetical protein SWZG_00150 [uncultured marine virus]